MLADELDTLLIPIVEADGAPLRDFSGHTDWRHAIRKRGEPQAFDFEAMGEEQHRAAYARLNDPGVNWAGGERNFRDLLVLGVKPSDRLLDLGCGPGRLGVHMIRYLDEGRYFGVDAHKHGLLAFSAYEARNYDLAVKRPKLMFDDQFRVSGFGEVFDVFADLMTLPWLEAATFVPALEQLRKCAHPESRLFSRWNESSLWDRMEEGGWRQETIEKVGKTRWRVLRPIEDA